MSNEDKHTLHSRTADAVGAKWGESHPEEDPAHFPPSSPPDPKDVVPNHHSASAEAAFLRWHEQHEDVTAQGTISPPDPPGGRKVPDPDA